jgi:hypothetical protein
MACLFKHARSSGAMVDASHSLPAGNKQQYSQALADAAII